MKTSTEIPAIYQKCHEQFGVDWDKGLAITYGDTVYSKFPLAPDVAVHEAVHIEQQKKIGAENWWNEYLSSPAFRLLQEIEAYRAQVSFIKKTVKDRNTVFLLIRKLAFDLSGPMYGGLMSPIKAREIIISNQMHKCPQCENMTSRVAASGLCLFCERKLPPDEQEKLKNFSVNKEPYQP